MQQTENRKDWACNSRENDWTCNFHENDWICDFRENDWICNLHELDCSDEMIMQVISLVKNHDMEKAAELLRRHKRILLDQLHHSENRVDLLDFLLYQLRKAKN